jgi:hypothetical protein
VRVDVGGSCETIEIDSCLEWGSLVQRLLRYQVHGERREHSGERGESQEHLADAWLLRFEDDHRNRPFGPLLVAGVALVP